MIVLIDKRFEKDTNKINDKSLLKKITTCIINIQNANSLNEIKNLKKLKGFDLEFRIKIGDYRIGLIIEDNKISLIRFLHRKDIYKFFPK